MCFYRPVHYQRRLKAQASPTAQCRLDRLSERPAAGGRAQHQQRCCASGEHPLPPDREEMVDMRRILIMVASLILVAGVILAAPR